MQWRRHWERWRKREWAYPRPKLTPMDHLRRAQSNQINFIEYGRWLERRWGPHGSERKEREQYRYHRELVAKYYARKLVNVPSSMVK